MTLTPHPGATMHTAAPTPRAVMAAHQLASIEATRAEGRMTATEARLAAADALAGLSMDDRHAARMESRRLLADRVTA